MKKVAFCTAIILSNVSVHQAVIHLPIFWPSNLSFFRLTLLMSHGGHSLVSDRFFLTTQHWWACPISWSQRRAMEIQKETGFEMLPPLFHFLWLTLCFIALTINVDFCHSVCVWCASACVCVMCKCVFVEMMWVCCELCHHFPIIPISYSCLVLLPNLPDLPQINLSAVIKRYLICSPTFTLTYAHKLSNTHTRTAVSTFDAGLFLSLVDLRQRKQSVPKGLVDL